MNYMLDTHALIWFINGDKELPSKSVKIIKDINNKCFVSIASLWELSIKISLGKLTINSDFNEIIDILNLDEIDIMPVNFEHLKVLNKLDYHHRDPFDRIIISQSIAENLTIISKDLNFHQYNINTIWK